MKYRHGPGHDLSAAQEHLLDERHQLEEYLEVLWTIKEQTGDGIWRVHEALGEAQGSKLLLSLRENRWIRIEGDKVFFEPEGEERAKEVVRRHRLAERLLHDVLDLRWERVEEDACRMEHILSPDVTDSICTFLGHPPTCPHGRMIPPGACCKRFSREVTPLVRPLSDLRVGEKGVITFMTPRYRSRLSQLSSLGVIPGTEIRLTQKRPAVVIEVGQSTVAMDKDLTRNIFVRATG